MSMAEEMDAVELLRALKHAHLVAYEEYLKAEPGTSDLDVAHQHMICTRRAYANACVEFCDKLIE